MPSKFPITCSVLCGAPSFAARSHNNREKQKLLRLTRQPLSDFPVTLWLVFHPHPRIKKCADIGSQISRRNASKKQLLREHAPRRVNANLLPLHLPSFKRCRYIRIHFAAQLPACISLLPNFSL